MPAAHATCAHRGQSRIRWDKISVLTHAGGSSKEPMRSERKGSRSMAGLLLEEVLQATEELGVELPDALA